MDDLKFRYQQHDGRNTTICAAACVAFIALTEFIGVPLAMLVCGAAVGFILARAAK